MKSKKVLIILTLIGIVLIVVFVFLRNSTNKIAGQGAMVHSATGEREIEYYTCGMHPSVRVTPEDYNRGNALCPICNMKLIPVYKEEQVKVSLQERKILFYRNPMNPAITSKEPAKDGMGMDYIPVYETREEDTAYFGCGMEGAEHVFSIKGAKNMNCPICGMPLKELSKEEANKLKGVISKVRITGKQAELAGVKTVPFRKIKLSKKIRTVGKVAYDPNLVIAQDEFVSALRALERMKEGKIVEIIDRARNLVESSRRKLRLLGLSQEQINNIEDTKKVQTNLILPEKKMWIYADVYEYELSWVKVGQKVVVTTSSFPGEEFLGIISSINPVLDPKTRSVTFRAEVDNPNLRLKPQMYVDVVIRSMYMAASGQHAAVLAVPQRAVLDTGTRKIVWVDRGNGEYEGRLVRIGPEAIAIVDGKEEKFYPVFSGLKEGELVVKKANFLIDSQSQISGVVSSAYGGALGAKEETTTTTPIHQH